MRQHKCPSRRFYPEWYREVAAVSDDFTDRTGVKYSPSKLDLLRKVEVAIVEQDTDLWADQKVSSASREFSRVSNREELLDLISDRLATVKDEYARFPNSISILSRTSLMHFWAVDFEAVYRCFQSDLNWIFCTLRSQVDEGKAPRRLKLKSLMFLEFFKLRDIIWSDKADLSRLSFHLSNIDISRFTDLYGQLCKQELKSIGKVRKSNDSTSFIHNELLPIMVRSIPGAFLRRITETAFDCELYREDVSKLEFCEFNKDISGDWWKRHPFKAWSESIMKNNSSGQPEDVSSRFDSEAIAVVYEAPWVMPSLVKNDGQAKHDSKRQSIPIPARSLKMEGRRQSYKPSENESVGEGSLCLAASDQPEDGFVINRGGYLDSFRDWNHDSSQEPAALMLNDQPLGDILEDLLHSPPQPSTRVTSPVKAAGQYFERSESSPKTVKRIRTQSPQRDAEPADDSENIAPLNPLLAQEMNTTPFGLTGESVVSTTLPSVDRLENNPKKKRVTKSKFEDAPSTERRKWRQSRDDDEYFQFNAF